MPIALDDNLLGQIKSKRNVTREKGLRQKQKKSKREIKRWRGKKK